MSLQDLDLSLPLPHFPSPTPPSATAAAGGSAGEIKYGHAYAHFVEDWMVKNGYTDRGTPSPVLSAWASMHSLDRVQYELETATRLVVPPGWVGPGEKGEGEGEVRRRVEVLSGRAVEVLKELYATTPTNYLLLLAPPFPVPPNSTFPALSLSPPAELFWSSLRGGPSTNLSKFLALSHATTTTRRLAIPTGDRSLDVKARLNALMRAKVREASGRVEAEMKWTRPEMMVVNYGVVLVGWPGWVCPGRVREERGEKHGDWWDGEAGAAAGQGGRGKGGKGKEKEKEKDREEEEDIPLRNPSNNSVKQNKRLLSLVESGVLYFVAATQADKDAVEAQEGKIPKMVESLQNAGLMDSPNTGGSGSGQPQQGDHGEQGQGQGQGQQGLGDFVGDIGFFDGEGISMGSWVGEELGAPAGSGGANGAQHLEEEGEGEGGSQDQDSPAGTTAAGRKRKQAAADGNQRKKQRSKPMLTLEVGGGIRPGPLEGRRRPGRPRKLAEGGVEAEVIGIDEDVIAQGARAMETLDPSFVEPQNEQQHGQHHHNGNHNSNHDEPPSSGYNAFDRDEVESSAMTLAAMSGAIIRGYGDLGFLGALSGVGGDEAAAEELFGSGAAAGGSGNMS